MFDEKINVLKKFCLQDDQFYGLPEGVWHLVFLPTLLGSFFIVDEVG